MTLTIAPAPVEIGQTVAVESDGHVWTGIVEQMHDHRHQRHYGIRPTDAATDDELEWVTAGHLRLQPWAQTRGPGAVRKHSHRLIDRDGVFICASDPSDCERLARSYADRSPRVEENQGPIWFNDAMNPDFYTGRETAAFLNGHP